MTRKHFEAIAAVIKSRLDDVAFNDRETLHSTAIRLAGEFKGFNPNFEVARFLKACGF